MINYLVGQKRLEELALRNLKYQKNSVDVEKLNSIQFPLKRLALDQEGNLFDTDENFLLFIDKFKETLEELDLGGRFTESVHAMIFKSFRNLKTLSVFINSAETDEAFYQNLRPNPSVRNLIIQGQTVTKSLQGFIENLPNIETLVLKHRNQPQELMALISNNFLKLKNLHLEGINSLFDSFNNQSVTSITITELCPSPLEQDNFEAVVKGFPNIENISINKFFGDQTLNNTILNIITKGWPQLRHVKLGEGFVVSESQFNRLMNNCKELRTVEIAEHVFEESSTCEKEAILRAFNLKGVQFNICQSSELCNSNCSVVLRYGNGGIQ